jgi:diguanylate cyclase (GGDEF)-like protein/PAS domain S-box-containing protein
MGKKYNYYSFVNEISTNFLKSYSFDKAINKSLKIILKRTKSDRTYIFLFSEDGKIMNNTHEYCKKGIEPQIANLKNIDTSELNWWIDSLKTDKIINIEDVSKMPKDASVEKKALESQNIRSLICFPFFIEKELIGFIGIDNVKDTGTWKDESIDYLKISAGLICKAIEKELINNEISQINSTLQATLETSDDAIVVIKKDSTILNYNENFIKLWNIQDEVRSNSNKVTMEVAKKTLLSPNPDEFQKRIEDTLSDPIKKDKFVAYRVDQSSIEITSRPLYVKNEHIGRVWKCTDITKQKSYEQRLQVISKVFEKSTDAILITDEFVRIIEINKAFENITGYSSDEVIGKNPSILQSNWHDERFYKEIWNSLDNKGYWEGEIWDRRKNGETYVNKTFISKIENKGAITNYIGISKDITQSKEYENKIKQLAFYDALTGLPNRTFFEQNLESVIDECNRYDRRFALLFIDLDNFKYVNDTFGHLTGDKLLQDVSNKLQKNVRKSDIVARLGGDEFTIIIKDLKNNLDIDKVANKIIKDISEPIIIDGNELHVGTSIGICIYPDDTSDSKELTKKADMAMYNSKK